MNYSITNRKFFAVVIALICVVISIASPMTASAESDTFVYDAAYDCNSDGIIDESDVVTITESILNSDNSYHVCDLIKAKRISYAMATANASKHYPMKFSVSDMNVCEANNMLHINFLLSDFDLIVREDTTDICFDFFENGICYYTIEWNKSNNVVYNVPLSIEDRLVSRDVSDVSFMVFVKDNKYMLDVVDIVPQLAPPLALSDYSEGPVHDSMVQELTELFGNDWKLVSAISKSDYVDFYFTSENSYADYMARIPVCKDKENGGSTSVISNVTVDGVEYTIFTENIGTDTNIVQLTAVNN